MPAAKSRRTRAIEPDYGISANNLAHSMRACQKMVQNIARAPSHAPYTFLFGGLAQARLKHCRFFDMMCGFQCDDDSDGKLGGIPALVWQKNLQEGW